MQELQSDDFFIPNFLISPLPQAKNDLDASQAEDFLKGIQGWAEYYPADECVE